MKIGWRRKTDEELIQRIRYWARIYEKWKWGVIGFMFFGGALVLLMMLTDLTELFNRSRSILETLSLRSYATGYVIGFLGGLILGAAIAYFTLGIFAIVGDVRRDRLLLFYHEILQQAGLLPEESAGKMKAAEHEPPRS